MKKDFSLGCSEKIIGLPPAETQSSLPLETQNEKYKTSARVELKALLSPLWKSKSARALFLIVVSALSVLILNVIGELRLNKWQGAFFSAIEHKKLDEVAWQSLMFVIIMVILLSFVVSQNWLLEQFKIKMREWLSHNLLDEWMKAGRAYRLNMTTDERLNPDQRIQEDIKHFSEMSGDLGMGITRSTLLLVSFIGVLWVMSEGIVLPILDYNLIIPGYMVWFTVFYAGVGSFFATKVGRPLIKLNEARYTEEANFRYSLVRVSDNAESIGFYKGESDERRTINANLMNVLSIMKKLSFANARLTWVACGHGWMVVILPVLVALPGYLQGKLDFGGLMMVVGAFNHVQQSLRWYVENFGRIADWRATLHRVAVFQQAVHTVDDLKSQQVSVITIQDSPEEKIIFDKTCIRLSNGQIVLQDITAEIRLGEKVLISGESGSGKSTLLRAMGGLWPWGSGSIHLPPRDEMMFLPQKPYIPLGSLAEALCYPHSSIEHDRLKIKDCLRRVNLSLFIPLLDEVSRWDKIMSLGQQQRLAFARLLLHRPKWIFLDEATSALDEQNQNLVMSIFRDELKASSLISVGHRSALELHHNRNLELIQTQKGSVLKRKLIGLSYTSQNSSVNTQHTGI